MFTDASRYARVPRDETVTADGRPVTAIRLRPLPPTTGEPHEVREHDRLDLLAHERYGDGTRFWHVADANRALEANRLVAEAGDTVDLPRT